MAKKESGWTLERRKKQSEAIRQWKPWKQSTGARTLEGKALVSRNAWKGGHRATIRQIAKMVNAEIQSSRMLVKSC